MIPKIIHYCWFGGNKKPKFVEKCIASWRKYCPDYEIKEWNESNFDINSNDYVREAYENKKWAFITDYVRLQVLVNYGGIYMDTDVEVLKPLDRFLDNEAFSGFQEPDSIPTGIMAAEKGQRVFVELLDYYKDKHFVKEDGSLDLTTNVTTITNILSKYGLKLDNSYQVIEGFALYPWDYFCPIQLNDGKKYLPSENTYTIHHFSGTWMPYKDKLKAKIHYMLGKKVVTKLSKIKQSIKKVFRRSK